MIIKRTSPVSGKRNQLDINVTREQIIAWEKGMLIQEAMPDITLDEREFIMSGITQDEWNKMFGKG
jgi:hypothetical protein